MGAPIEIFDEERAYQAIQEWLAFVFDDALTEPVPKPMLTYRGQQIAPARRPSIVYQATTPMPVPRGWKDDRKNVAQQQLWLVAIAAAAAGNYTIGVLGDPAPYLAGGADTPTVIRDGLRAAVDALGADVATADSGAEAFTIQGDNAGESLGVAVIDEPAAGSIVLSVVDDNIRSCAFRPCFWTVRFTVTDMKPDDVTPSRAREWALRLRSNFEAGTRPIVNGNATVYLKDILSDGSLAYNTLVAQQDTTFNDGGIFTDRVTVDIRFTTQVGLDYDIPSLDAVSPPAVEVQEAPPQEA